VAGLTELGKKIRVGRLAGMLGTDGLAVWLALSSIGTVEVLGAASGSLKVSVTLVVGGCVVRRLDTVIKENCAFTAVGVIRPRGVATLVEISDEKRELSGMDNIIISEEARLVATPTAATVVDPAALTSVLERAVVLAVGGGPVLRGTCMLVIVLSGIVAAAIVLGW
jgi:hypothetical protein